MKPLLLSTNDIAGGAARAAYRLHQSLRRLSVPAQFLVQNKDSVDPTVIAQKSTLSKVSARFNGFPTSFYRYRMPALFSPQWLPDRVAAKVLRMEPDLINLHWVCNGYLQIETLQKFKPPLVWTLHDMWPFTGGCHYTQTCDRYEKACGNCPLLSSQHNWDTSRWIWHRKANVYKSLNLTLVAPSQWMADCAHKSSLLRDFRVEVIPHGLNTDVFKPVDKTFARHLLNLPQDKQLVLFGAGSGAVTDPRKGLHLLHRALRSLSQQDWATQLELVIFGASQPEQPVNLGFKAHYLGHFHDDLTLALVYSAADVMVVPSVQEAFGQTASESLACGTPVVAFRATGLQDIVQHGQDGYLATPFEVDDLAQGITWILSDQSRYLQLAKQAREKSVREFSPALQARRYLALFSELI